MKYFILVSLIFLISSCGNKFYIVRHAEKATVPAGSGSMEASDPPLSQAGTERATALKEKLLTAKVTHFYSTNYKRTKSTAQPLSEAMSKPIQIYSARNDSMDAFILRLRSIKKGNVLVVGHSNTIDDLANKLTGSTVVPGDLADNQYDNLYEIRRKGRRFVFTGRKYGNTSF